MGGGAGGGVGGGVWSARQCSTSVLRRRSACACDAASVSARGIDRSALGSACLNVTAELQRAGAATLAALSLPPLDRGWCSTVTTEGLQPVSSRTATANDRVSGDTRRFAVMGGES